MLVLVGDALHNALDGVLIAAAFLTDFHLGIVTALAIMAHEMPQEVGNFAVLLHSGMSRGRALRLEHRHQPEVGARRRARLFRAARVRSACCPMRSAVAAASLLYVAVADLIPGLHRRSDPRPACCRSC